MKSLLSLSLAVLVLSTVSNICLAQIQATTDDNKRVVLYENGTWKYADEAGTQQNSDMEGCEKGNFGNIRIDNPTNEILTITFSDGNSTLKKVRLPANKIVPVYRVESQPLKYKVYKGDGSIVNAKPLVYGEYYVEKCKWNEFKVDLE